jgi:hypothetical protein
MTGRPIRERRRLATSVLVLLAVALSLATAPLVLAAPTLDISPSSGVPGATLTATATEFPPGAVTFRWDNGTGNGALLGTATANAQGTAVLQFDIPSGAAPGAHFVRACDANRCPPGDVFADASVTVLGAPTPPPTPPPTPAPTSTGAPSPSTTAAPTPAPTSTPRPTPRSTPTPRPPGVTPEPSGPSPSVAASPVPSGDTSPGPSPAATAAPSGSPVASGDGVVAVPTAAPAGQTATPGPLPGSPASEVDPFVGRLALPIGLITALVLAGFLLAKVRGPGRQPAPAGAAAAGAAAAGAPRDVDGTALSPELYSALADPVGPSFEPVPPAESDPWANARTIAVHVEQVEPHEE